MSILNESGIYLGQINPTYEKFFQSPWAPDISIEMEHFKVTQMIKRWSLNPKDGTADKIQVAKDMNKQVLNIKCWKKLTKLFETDDFVRNVDALHHWPN